MRTILALLCTTLLASCAPMQPPPTLVAPPFNPQEFASVAKKGAGTTTISGQVFMMTIGGDVKKGAGRGVLLVPKVPSAESILDQLASGAMPSSAMDKRYGEYFYGTTADADGKFHFDNVADGTYIAEGSVSWMAPSTIYPYGLIKQGGTIQKEVTVQKGKSVEVILTK